MNIQGSIKSFEIMAPKVEQNLINKKLPIDIIKHILFFIDNRDIKSTVLLSRFWNKVSTEVLTNRINSLISNFTKLLTKNLNKELYANQIQELSNITSKNNILNVNLSNFKSSISELQEKILILLKSLKEEDLNAFENASRDEVKTSFFKNVFNLVRIYKKLDEFDPNLIGMTFTDIENRNICKALIQNGRFNKALEVAHKILAIDARIGSFTLQDIFEDLKRSEDIDKALEVARSMPTTNGVKAKALQDIFKIFKQSEKMDKALEVAYEILAIDSWFGSFTLQDIFEDLKRSEDIDKALEVARSMPTTNGVKAKALQDVFKVFRQSEKIDKALEVAYEILAIDSSLGSQALQDIEKPKI